MKNVDFACTLLILFGALNWGMIGIFDIDVIDFFLEKAWMDRLVYSIIAAAGLYKIIYWPSIYQTYMKNVDTFRDDD
jgi:uncharacterized membrane protein YuzA (DUF378 family)